MYFDEIVGKVARDLNLTSAEAIDRIGQNVNRRYRRVMNGLGINEASRAETSFALAANQQDQSYDLDNPTLQRIVSIWRKGDSTSTVYSVPLEEISYDEMQATVPTEDDPTKWCKVNVYNGRTDFRINSTIPDGFTVFVSGESLTLDLEGQLEPAFPEAYHDILWMGAKADELRKLKDAASLAVAKELEGNAQEPWLTPYSYNGLLAELRLKNTLSPFVTVVQGKYAASARKPFQRTLVVTSPQ
jgi:hypothetical protein